MKEVQVKGHHRKGKFINSFKRTDKRKRKKKNKSVSRVIGPALAGIAVTSAVVGAVILKTRPKGSQLAFPREAVKSSAKDSFAFKKKRFFTRSFSFGSAVRNARSAPHTARKFQALANSISKSRKRIRTGTKEEFIQESSEDIYDAFNKLTKKEKIALLDTDYLTRTDPFLREVAEKNIPGVFESPSLSELYATGYLQKKYNVGNAAKASVSRTSKRKVKDREKLASLLNLAEKAKNSGEARNARQAYKNLSKKYKQKYKEEFDINSFNPSSEKKGLVTLNTATEEQKVDLIHQLIDAGFSKQHLKFLGL